MARKSLEERTMELFPHQTELDKEISNIGGWHEYHQSRNDHTMADYYSELYQKLLAKKKGMPENISNNEVDQFSVDMTDNVDDWELRDKTHSEKMRPNFDAQVDTYAKLNKERKRLSESDSDVESVVNTMKQEIKNVFPYGWASVSKGSLGGNTAFIKFGALDRESLSGGIANNDPMFHMFSIEELDDGRFLLEKNNGSIAVNPREKFMAMSSVKTPFRKTTGNSTKVINAFGKFLSNTRKLFDDNEAEIYNRKRYDDKFWK